MPSKILPTTDWHEYSTGGEVYLRTVVSTPWLQPADDLLDALLRFLPLLSSGDTVVISEKVAVLLSGKAVPMASVRPGPLARRLARSVRPRDGSRGLSVPEKMQYVISTVGRGRLCFAAVVAAFTRPLGRRGDFYRVAGTLARDLDGGRPPYEHLLFPPLEQDFAALLCRTLEDRLGVGVAIVDLNDYGGSIRATSPAALPPAVLMRALADNPLRQRLTGTPFGVVRLPSSAPSNQPDHRIDEQSPLRRPQQQQGAAVREGHGDSDEASVA